MHQQQQYQNYQHPYQYYQGTTYEQQFYGQQLQQINKIYIKTQSYGNIFSYAVGKPGQPLIIIVHGSGPKNSADQYLYLLHEYLVRISYIQKYYIIAIDCPGYGRSKGSKQAIKTFPLQMFRQILKQLKYNSYYAMLGHSQGGAAIFNAVYQDRKLTQYLLMDRPVCGNIKRFNKFPLPTLLVYDIQDDGHPIWQGKLLFKELLVSEFYTYRASQNVYYVPDNLWNFILRLFNKYKQGKKVNKSVQKYHSRVNHKSNDAKYKNKQQNKSQSKSKSKDKYLKRNANSLTKFQQEKREKQKQIKKENYQLKKIQQVDKSQLHSIASMSVEMQELQDLPTWMNQPKVEQTYEQVMAEKQMKRKLEQMYLKKQKIRQEEKEKQQEKKKQQIAKIMQKQQNIMKKSPKKQKQQIKPQPPKQKALKQEKPKQQTQKQNPNKQQMQNKCSICHQQYFHPLQTNCKHLFCKKCLGQSLLIDERCPLCRTKVTKKDKKQQLHNQIVQKLPQKQKQRRQKQLLSFENMLKSIIYIEIGNSSRILQTKKSHFSKTKTKYIWQLFVKQPKNFKLQQVHFNINMGQRDSKPVKILHPPFVFQSRGTFSFSCQIAIKPKNKDYAPITSIYRIDVNPGIHSKIIALKKKKN